MLKSVNAALEQPERGESSWKANFRAENKRLLCETGHPTCLTEARDVQSRTNTSNPDEDKLYVVCVSHRYDLIVNYSPVTITLTSAGSWIITCAYFSVMAHSTSGSSDYIELCTIRKISLRLKDYSYLDR